MIGFGTVSGDLLHSYKFKTKHVAIKDSPIITMDAMKNFPINGVTFDVVGVFSAIMSINTVIANKVVMTKVTRSPVAGGSRKVNKPRAVIKKHGTIKLLK